MVCGMGAVVFAVLACKGGKTGDAEDAATTAVTTATAAASTPATSASAAALDAAKPVGAKPKPAKGCPLGWTRTTKGICVDWCEVDDDCDDGKTCQNSNHVDPDLGKIKTCQTSGAGQAGPSDASTAAAASAKPAATCSTSAVSDEVECEKENCPTGWMPGSKLGGARQGACLRQCKTKADCKVKGNECVAGACDPGSE